MSATIESTGGRWLYDTDRWRTRDGRVLLISEMKTDHLRRTINYLLREAQRLYMGEAFYMTFVAASHDGGDAAQDALDAEAEAIWDLAPAQWLASTPIYQALDREYRRRVAKGKRRGGRNR
jgi:hypothetical protein